MSGSVGRPQGKGEDYERMYVLAVASGDRSRARMCLSKGTYHSIASAEAVIRERERKTRKPLRWYECPYCGLYHLTSKPERDCPRAA